jgi:exopolysaccharide biosynthesis polyprenyl glycosylphosphotransferase
MSKIEKLTKRHRETLVLLLMDFFSLFCGNSVYYYFRVHTGLFKVVTIPEYWGPTLMLTLFFLFLFWFVGLYKFTYLSSRLDEFAAVVKASIIGVLIIFFAVFFDDAASGKIPNPTMFVLLYWCALVFLSGFARIAWRTIQKKLLVAGVGLRNAIIVGSGERARSVFAIASKYRTLGYKPLGFVVASKDANTVGLPAPLLSDTSELAETINRLQVKEVVIALEERERENLHAIISNINGADASIKIVPDLYDSIAGQAHTSQLHGFPLIEVVPQIMPQWQMVTKRLIDIVVSTVALIAGVPLWILISLAISLDSAGRIIYPQERIGKDGARFTLFKFRSMYKDAEKETGPVWASRNDPRVTRVGRFLRKTHLDETPQFVNVLKGEMSLVGPRPERPFFVEMLLKEIPLYKRRLKVKPGITGLARVKFEYDESIEDVKIDLQYDLFYIENMSLRLDFQILYKTIFHVLLGKDYV